MMGLKKGILSLLLSAWILQGNAQSSKNEYLEYGRWVVDTLSSPYFYGRGYLREGMRNASFFIATEMLKMQLEKFPEALNYYQNFTYSVNTFPDNIYLSFDDRFLEAGKEYIPGPRSSSLKGEFQLLWLDNTIVSNPEAYKKFSSNDFSKSVIVIDDKNVTSTEGKQVMKQMASNPFGAKAIIYIKDKLTMPVRQDTVSYAEFYVLRSALKEKAKKTRISIANKFEQEFKAANLVGAVKGSEKPDSFLVFTAHYDHVGGIGNQAYFPGANDNASGTAMLLSLAKYFSKPENKPKYSILFIAFAGEEAGLLGSLHYVLKKPVKPLQQIKFLINIDMVGTGDEGISIVNGLNHPQMADKIKKISTENNLIDSIYVGRPSNNSDHYFFVERGVPAFFIFTRGGIQAYHDVYDKRETLPLTKFAELHELLRKFVDEIQNQ